MADDGVYGKRKSKRDKKAKSRYNVYKKGGGRRTVKFEHSSEGKVKKKKK